MAVLVGLAMLSAVYAVDGGGGGEVAEPEPEVEVAEVPEVPVRDAIDRRLDCIAWYESRNTPSARNRSSGASGLLQFLPSTWRTTPQGKAGLSIWDANAQWQAGRWMLQQGRAKEWVPIQRGLC